MARRAYGAHRAMTPRIKARNVAESIARRQRDGQCWCWEDYGLAGQPAQQALVRKALAVITA